MISIAEDCIPEIRVSDGKFCALEFAERAQRVESRATSNRAFMTSYLANMLTFRWGSAGAHKSKEIPRLKKQFRSFAVEKL